MRNITDNGFFILIKKKKFMAINKISINPKFKLPDKPKNQKYGNTRQASVRILIRTSTVLREVSSLISILV